MASKLLHFHSRDDKVAAQAALDRTVAHIIDHNSVLECAKRKVKRSGPAPIVVELEQTINMVAYCFNSAKTDAKFFSTYSPMFCNDRAHEIKSVSRNLKKGRLSFSLASDPVTVGPEEINIAL